MKIKYKTRGRNEKWHTGRLIREYKHFYLVRHTLGYRECINKIFVTTGDVKMEVLP